jgi:hypothetical protein
MTPLSWVIVIIFLEMKEEGKYFRLVLLTQLPKRHNILPSGEKAH